MALQAGTRPRRARADDDEPEVDLDDDEERDERAHRRTAATARRARPVARSRREPDEDEAEPDEELDQEALAYGIAEVTAERVSEKLRADQRKVNGRLAEHERRLGDLEEAQDELTAELAKLAAKAEAKAAGTVGATSEAAPAAGAREIAVVEPDLGKEHGKDEGRLPEEPGGPKQPRSGWRSIW